MAGEKPFEGRISCTHFAQFKRQDFGEEDSVYSAHSWRPSVTKSVQEFRGVPSPA
jgi:hypothetical protein